MDCETGEPGPQSIGRRVRERSGECIGHGVMKKTASVDDFDGDFISKTDPTAYTTHRVRSGNRQSEYIVCSASEFINSILQASSCAGFLVDQAISSRLSSPDASSIR